MSALTTEGAEATGTEDLESFRERARLFIRGNLRNVGPNELRWELMHGDDEAERVAVAHDRKLQRMLFDAGLAGICLPA